MSSLFKRQHRFCRHINAQIQTSNASLYNAQFTQTLMPILTNTTDFSKTLKPGLHTQQYQLGADDSAEGSDEGPTHLLVMTHHTHLQHCDKNSSMSTTRRHTQTTPEPLFPKVWTRKAPGQTCTTTLQISLNTGVSWSCPWWGCPTIPRSPGYRLRLHTLRPASSIVTCHVCPSTRFRDKNVLSGCLFTHHNSA